MSKAKTPKVSPTYTGYIATSKDALIIFQAVLTGALAPVHRRPSENERNELVKSGNVFVFIEETSRIKRWTDGISWSPSRILGRFLIYRELSKNPNLKNEDHHASKNRRSSFVSDKLLNPETKSPRRSPNSDSPTMKSSNCPITAYAMAGGKEIISGINRRKRSRADSFYRNEDNIVNNNEKNITNNTNTNINDNTSESNDTNGTSNTNDNNDNNGTLKSHFKYDIHSESLDDTIYKTDGLIKKSNSLTLYTNTSYKKTMHLVSYYRSEDVLENLLEKPSEDENLKDIEISFDLLEALRNTSLGHAIPSKKNGEFSIESHGFMDTDGFDEESILKFAKEYYDKYNIVNKRRQITPVMQGYDPYRMNNPQSYYVTQNGPEQYPAPQIMEHSQPQVNQYHISYLPPQPHPQTQQQHQQQQQQQPHQQQLSGPLNNYSYKYDYTYQPVHYQQLPQESSGPIYGQINRSSTTVPVSTPLSARAPAYLSNPQRSISETLVAPHSSRIGSPPTNSYGYNCSGSLVPPLPVKNQRSSSDDQYVSNKLPQLQQPLIPRPNYDIYPYGVNGSHVIDPQQQQQQQQQIQQQQQPQQQQQLLHAQPPPPPPLLQTPTQDQSQIHARTHSPPDQISTRSHSPYSFKASQLPYHIPTTTGPLAYSQSPGVIASRSNQYVFPSSAQHLVESQQGSNITRSTTSPTSSRISSVRLGGPGSIGTFNSTTTMSRAETPNTVVTHYYATNPADFSIS